VTPLWFYHMWMCWTGCWTFKLHLQSGLSTFRYLTHTRCTDAALLVGNHQPALRTSGPIPAFTPHAIYTGYSPRFTIRHTHHTVGWWMVDWLRVVEPACSSGRTGCIRVLNSSDVPGPTPPHALLPQHLRPTFCTTIGHYLRLHRNLCLRWTRAMA